MIKALKSMILNFLRSLMAPQISQSEIDAEVARLITAYAAARKAHRPSRALGEQLRAMRILQLQRRAKS